MRSLRYPLLLALGLVLGLTSISEAAITFVSQTDATDTKNVLTVTKSVTVSAGTDRFLAVCSQVRRNTDTAYAISGVTFNGSESFTRVRTPDVQNTPGQILQAELWYLVAPTVTTADLVVTYAGLNEQAIGVSASQFNGVNQSSPIDSHAGSNGTSTTPSVTITTVADNAAILDCVIGKSDSGLTVGAGQTVRTDRIIGVGGVNDGAGVSTVVTKTPAGSEPMNWTQPDAFGWVMSALSLTPSGGTDPNPAVLGQATISWTNGTDPGNPSSGIASTTIKRCTGTGCAAGVIGAPAVGTVAYPGTSFVNTGLATDTTYGYSNFHTDGVGRTSTDHATVYITTTATPADAPPTITGAVTDATGSTLTYGVTPTQIRVMTYTNARGVISTRIHEITDFPSGRITQTWQDGLDGVCFYPIDAAGIEGTGYLCTPLAGIVGPLDETPPVLSACQPTTDLPAGTTEWTMSCEVNKPSSARYDTTDIAYADMTNDMARQSLTFSATVTGLTNGSTTTLYLRPQLTDINEVVHPALTSTVVTLTVASSTADTTPPADVTGLAATLLGNAASLTWNAAADAVSYQVYQADGDCSVYAPAGNPTTTTSLQLSLNFGTVYCWKVKGLDVVSNFSADFSAVETLTTLAQPDIEPPSDLEGLRLVVFTQSVQASWLKGTDNLGQVSVNLEYCLAEVGQEDCANFDSKVDALGQDFLTLTLLPGRWYCFRGKNSDGTNVSLNYSEVVCKETATTGLSRPRAKVPFSTPRARRQ